MTKTLLLTAATFVTLLFLAFAACAPPGYIPPDDDDEASPTPTPVWMPLAGHWLWSEFQFVQNDCNVDPDDVQVPGFDLGHTGDGLFTVLNDGSERPPLSCALTEQAYTCDPDVIVTDLAERGFDNAVITSTQTTTGSFVDETNMSMAARFDVDCSGDDCFWVELGEGVSFPCVTSVDLTGVADLQ